MVKFKLTDWFPSGSAQGISWGLDTGIKAGGTSSYLCNWSEHVNYSPVRDCYSERVGFAAAEVMVIGWARVSGGGGQVGEYFDNRIYHPSYGDIVILSANVYGGKDWTKFRATFWYDPAADTKFGRLELWDGADWVQQGNDINFGRGAPAADTIKLHAYFYGYNDFITNWDVSASAWWDELEVYRRIPL